MYTYQEVYTMIHKDPKEALLQARMKLIKELESGKSIRQVARESKIGRNTLRLKDPTRFSQKPRGGPRKTTPCEGSRGVFRRLREKGFLPPKKKKRPRKGYRDQIPTKFSEEKLRGMMAKRERCSILPLSDRILA